MSAEPVDNWMLMLLGASRSGLYTSGYVEGRDAFNSLLQAYNAATQSSFAIRQSTSEYKADIPSLLSGFSRRQVLWRRENGCLPIPCDGTPFTVCGRTVALACNYGPRRHNSYCPKRKPALQGETPSTGKGHCKAVVKIVRVLRFPDHSLDLSPTTSAFRRRRLKEDATTKLWSLCTAKTWPRVVERFYVLLPSVEAHEGHTLPGTVPGTNSEQKDLRSPSTHPDVIRRIYDLVYGGVRNARDIRNVLNAEINEMKEKKTSDDLQPKLLDRTWHPSLKVIRWHIFAATRKVPLLKVTPQERAG